MITVTATDTGTYVQTSDATIVYMWHWPYGTGELCPRCGCCSWETRGFDEGEGVCVGHCDYEEAHDHPVVLQRYCPACLAWAMQT